MTGGKFIRGLLIFIAIIILLLVLLWQLKKLAGAVTF